MKKLLLCGFALLAPLALFLTGCSDNSRPAVKPNVAPQQQAAPGNPAQPAGPGQTATLPPGDPNAKVALETNYYFVIDGSGSMSYRAPRSAGGDKRFDTKMEGAIWAVTETVMALPDTGVNLGLYVFDSHYGEKEVLPLGPINKQAFIAAVKKIRAGGGTPLARGVTFGTQALSKQYEKQLGYGEYRLFVVTDGEADDMYALNRAVDEAAKAKPPIPIYTIGFGIGDSHSLRKSSVSYRAADSAAEVKQALKEFTSELDVNGDVPGK